MPKCERDDYGAGHYRDIRFDLEQAAKMLRNPRAQNNEGETRAVIHLVHSFLYRMRYMTTVVECVEMAGVVLAG